MEPLSTEVLADLDWRAAGGDGAGRPALEIARTPDGGFAMRRADEPGGPVLVYTQAEMEAFLLGIKDGDFDDLVEDAAS